MLNQGESSYLRSIALSQSLGRPGLTLSSLAAAFSTFILHGEGRRCEQHGREQSGPK